MITLFSDVPNESQDKPPPICDPEPEIESDEFTYHPCIDYDVDEDLDDDLTDDQDEEAFGDDIVESSILVRFGLRVREMRSEQAQKKQPPAP